MRFWGLLIVGFWSMSVNAQRCPSGKFALVLHGGAGKWDLTSEGWEKYKTHLTRFLEEGHASLKEGGSSLDAVQTLVERMEDSGIFNAGKGAVRNSEKVVELDASIMDGKTLKAGAVASVKTLKNPIRAARAVMEKTVHVLLAGKGAEIFGAKNGVTEVAPSYFEELKPANSFRNTYGTVGAVALDCHGNLAAATSTGGLEGKLPGRVGDSPIIGAGNYADNKTCAVSATGKGEFFIRAAASKEVSALMEYQKASVKEAADGALKKVSALGGTGGFISVDKYGNIAMPFNTEGMVRGYVREDGKINLAILPGELEGLLLF